MTSKIIGDRYEITDVLGKGTFGIVFRAKDVRTQNEVAIKTDQNAKTIKHEARIIQYLYAKKVRKIPKIYWYGTIKEQVFLIMELYEYSLYDIVPKLLEKSHKDRMMSVHSIIRHILDIFHTIHTHYVIHRDIKPQNFMFKNGAIYLIDFGMATFYVDEKTEHKPNLKTASLVGTPKYASHHIHRANTYSRRDDIISIGYMAIFLETGKTGWYSNSSLEETAINKENIARYSQDPLLQEFLYDQYKVEYCGIPGYKLCGCGESRNGS